MIVNIVVKKPLFPSFVCFSITLVFNNIVKHPYIGTIGFAETENVLFPNTKPTKKFLWVFNGGTKDTDGAGQWHLWSSGVEMPPTGGIIIDQDYLNNLP
ncbi:MAG: hypothetical protein ACK5MD_06040 [Flavobacteriales bacterium]